MSCVCKYSSTHERKNRLGVQVDVLNMCEVEWVYNQRRTMLEQRREMLDMMKHDDIPQLDHILGTPARPSNESARSQEYGLK